MLIYSFQVLLFIQFLGYQLPFSYEATYRTSIRVNSPFSVIYQLSIDCRADFHPISKIMLGASSTCDLMRCALAACNTQVLGLVGEGKSVGSLFGWT